MQDLDTTVKSMMDTSQNMIRGGNCQKKAKICKICGKEGGATAIKNHIEVNHLEGVSIPCNQCEKTFRSRNALTRHNSAHHLQYWYLFFLGQADIWKSISSRIFRKTNLDIKSLCKAEFKEIICPILLARYFAGLTNSNAIHIPDNCHWLCWRRQCKFFWPV